jgi:thiol-disulfide isomerase/thioredoxin
LLPLVVLSALAMTGCDQLTGVLQVREVQARTGEDSIDLFLTYQEALIGKDPDSVVEVFGKPKGIFERRSSTVWMYSRWCVEFDANHQVVRMERDIASTGSGRAAASDSMALAAKPAPPVQAPAGSGGVTKVSNGGQSVDLNSLMPAGKITVVDFYADWCGPCRSIAPHLEKLAKENPNVVLVKVDIVKWGTPVTKQHNINSVPNIRVFDRNRRPMGQPTSSLSQVQSYIEKAGG